MAKFILCAAMALVLTACGGGGEAPAKPTSGGVSLPACMARVITVALLGDSTQYGYDGATKAIAVHSPGAELQFQMDFEFGKGAVVVTDYGVPGSTAKDAPHVVADVIVANYGINDMMTETTDDYTAAMRLIGATLIETQSPIALPSNELGFVTAARALDLPVADTYAYVESLTSWRAYLSDGVHPDDALYLLIIDNVLAPAVAKEVAPLRCS
jgi:hypothetical protein